MFEPVKAGLGQYMARFYEDIAPTTRPMEEFVVRGLGKSILWAPGRMVDAAEDMLSLYAREKPDDGAPTKPFELPVMFVAMAKDYTPTGREFTRQVGEREWVTIPGDDKGRVFRLRTIAADIRTQVVIAAADEPTARSIAAQLALFIDSVGGRRFSAPFLFAGESLDWPVVIETPDVTAMAVQGDAKNLTMLAMDMTLKATVPLFDAPRPGQVNDGQGVPGTPDPAGYPVVNAIYGSQFEAPTYAPESLMGTWQVGE
ncbi:MAG TPA: hypothetical protein VIG97_07385 [Luteimonas sp.]